MVLSAPNLLGRCVTAEPDMEDLLASIRQAIDSDLGDVRRSTGSYASGTVKGTMNEMRVRVGINDPRVRASEITKEINELRSKIGTQRPADAPKPKTPFAQIMAGSLDAPAPQAPSTSIVAAQQPEATPLYHDAAEEQPESYASEGEWHGEQAYLPAPDHALGYDEFSQPQLISEGAARQANSSFNELAETLMQRAMGERSIEDVTHELLRSMLRDWLDHHLPSMVERLVREEIERVARRGR
jgi:uncharacterized protein